MVRATDRDNTRTNKSYCFFAFVKFGNMSWIMAVAVPRLEGRVITLAHYCRNCQRVVGLVVEKLKLFLCKFFSCFLGLDLHFTQKTSAQEFILYLLQP